MSPQSKVVTFNLTCPEWRAWLVLDSDDRKPLVFEMRQQRPTVWSACADLT